jgi:hypothetical protein
MSNFIKLLKSPIIQIALATGLSIIIMAYFSKKVIPESIGYLPMAIPPFIMSIHSSFYNRCKNRKIWTTWYWITAIICSTIIIIVIHLI